MPPLNIYEIKKGLYLLNNRLTEETTAKIDNLENQAQAIQILSTIIDRSKPIDEDCRKILSLCFESCYKDPNAEAITYPELKIEWAVLEQLFGFPNPSFASNEGVGFFYLLNNNNQLTFVIAKAKRETVGTQLTITPVNSEGPYVMFDPMNTTGSLITKNTFISYSLAYKNSIKFETVFGPPALNVADFNHPMVTFHEGTKFINFFNNNFPVSAPDNLYLVAEHGTSLKTTIQDLTGLQLDSCCLHAAMVFFQIDENQLLLNNIHDTNFPFLNKGLDVGRLCPPDC